MEGQPQVTHYGPQDEVVAAFMAGGNTIVVITRLGRAFEHKISYGWRELERVPFAEEG
jgi:hypothetical protein